MVKTVEEEQKKNQEAFFDYLERGLESNVR